MKAVEVPMMRVWRRIGPQRGAWYTPAFQGPRGLYGIRQVGGGVDPIMFQVCRLEKGYIKDISEAWMTLEGARKFARRIAEGENDE